MPTVQLTNAAPRTLVVIRIAFTHSHGNIKVMGREYVSVRLPALDDLPVAELIAAPVHYMDGRHDNWQNPPDEIRQL
ncbi:MAG: hypothetical protein ABI645_05655 [Pseudomonadota bacterium]